MIIIGGPTASGKTALAAEVALRLGGEIVSADSMQIYKGMDIGTAKAKDSELGVKQHLVDVAEPDQAFSVVDYRHYAEAAIRDIEARKKLPVIAGGTGFYISSLLTEYGYGNESNPEIRNQLIDEYEGHGAEYMHDKLRGLDPESAAKIHANNTKRVLRAIEVCLETGKPFSNQQNIIIKPVSPYILFILRTETRQNLYNRIDNRVTEMITKGLETEVKNLIETKNLDFGIQSMQGIGYKEWKPRFDNPSVSVNEVTDAIKKNTRAYAKRQQTWFAHQYEKAVFLDIAEPVGSLADKVVEYYNINNN